MKISIITPVYKPTVDMFERTLLSVEEQISSNYEWVLVFDGGLLNTDALYGCMELLDKSVAAHKNASLWDNYGPSVARNVAFQLSDGDIITYVDVGDTLNPSRVEVLQKGFEIMQMDLLFAPYELVSNGSQVAKYHPTWPIHRHGSLAAAMRAGNISIPLGVAHTREYFVKAGGFQPGIVCGEDGILWRRMFELGAAVEICNSMAGTYFISDVGQSRTQRRFEMGGFAFDGLNIEGSHGQYLDKDWFRQFHSRERYDR